MKPIICFVFGTRPECIKLAPVIDAFKKSGKFKVKILNTGQHKEMLQQALDIFELTPDIELNLMSTDQSLSSFVSMALVKLDEWFKNIKPDIVFVQGDTSTVLAASLAAFFNKIKLYHIEAGLRTHKKFSPYPEEMNRLLATRLADIHFAPTINAKMNLLREGVCEDSIFITGNTSIDSLLMTLNKNHSEKSFSKELLLIPKHFIEEKKIILITGHRRENFGSGFIDICNAIKELASLYVNYLFVYPVHLNPHVQNTVFKILQSIPNIMLLKPLDFINFTFLMDASHIILTDSGGIQEEAPSLKKPILVLREDTERQEGIDNGNAILVGTNKELIIKQFNLLMTDDSYYNSFTNRKNPYGDGKASQIILNIVEKIHHH